MATAIAAMKAIRQRTGAPPHHHFVRSAAVSAAPYSSGNFSPRRRVFKSLFTLRNAQPMHARVVPFPVSMTKAPLCAQCHAPMVLLRVVRTPGQPVVEKFVCAECRLIDSVTRSPQASAIFELAKSA